MAGKKSSILTVLVILSITAIFLGTVTFITLKVLGPSSRLSFHDRIGVITINGPITESRKITESIIKLKKDGKIKAIVLRINSPGGSVGATQEIYREIKKTVQSKHVVASLGDVAASGGYYIAAAADRIVANPGTITGSIGVLMHFVQLKNLLDKVGIGLEVLKSGEFKDIGSPHRKMTEREKELMGALIADIQKQFVEAVSTGRHLPLEKIREIADGRVFTGSQAKKLGLVDSLGNFQDAVDTAKSMSGIRGDVTLVYPQKEELDLWDLLFNRASGMLSELTRSAGTRIEYRWQGLPGQHVKGSY